MHTGLCAWSGWDDVVFDGQSSIRQNIHGAESDSVTLSLRLIFQADCVLTCLVKACGADENASPWRSQRLSADYLSMLIFLTFSFFPSCGRIKLHLLQVLHHRRKHCDVSEDYTEEWVRASLNCCPTLSAHSSISCSTSRCLLLLLLHQSVLVFVLSLLLSLITSSLHSFRLPIVWSLSVWGLFCLRCVQVSPSCHLTSHFTGESIILRPQGRI